MRRRENWRSSHCNHPCQEAGVMGTVPPREQGGWDERVNGPAQAILGPRHGKPRARLDANHPSLRDHTCRDAADGREILA
eukprot:5282621-Prymnesium_polylepis.2